MANGNFFGEFSDFLGEDLTQTIQSGGMSDFLSQMLLTGKKDIARGAGRARETLRETSASSGFGGVSANVITDIFAEESSQVGQLKTQVGGLAEASKSQAVSQLLGLTQFQGQQELGGAQLELSRDQLEEMARQFDVTTEEGKRQFEKMFGLKERELDAMIDAQGGDFLSVLGNMFGTGAGIAMGAGIGSLFS
jgi:hypothetical protein